MNKYVKKSDKRSTCGNVSFLSHHAVITHHQTKVTLSHFLVIHPKSLLVMIILS